MVKIKIFNKEKKKSTQPIFVTLTEDKELEEIDLVFCDADGYKLDCGIIASIKKNGTLEILDGLRAPEGIKLEKGHIKLFVFGEDN